MKDGITFTRYHLLVLNELLNDPYFLKRNILIRYVIPRKGEKVDENVVGKKIMAVWDLRDVGAFEIVEEERLEGIKKEFLLKILQPEFDQIYKKIKSGIQETVIHKPADWGWQDKRKGIYQFGTKMFQQTGEIRGKVFQALMDTFEKSPQAISVNTLRELTGLTGNRIRIEISGINIRLAKLKLRFIGSGKGAYMLQTVK